MPHISPRKVNKNILQQIYKIVFSAVSSKNVSPKLQESTFQEILTPTEKIMLGKRLAAVSLLSQGAPQTWVEESLCLSETTVRKIKIKMERGKFSNTKKLCTALRKGPLQTYLENLLKPLPRYGTSPSKVFRDM